MPSASTLGSAFGRSTASVSPVLIRRFRRTARGLSSVMSTTWCVEGCVAIARRLLCIGSGHVGRKKGNKEECGYKRKDRVRSKCQEEKQEE